MKTINKFSLLVATFSILTACSTGNDYLFSNNEVKENRTNNYSSTNVQQSITLPHLGSANFAPVNVSQGKATGTFVGQKITSFRGEISSLQDSIVKHNEDLQNIRGNINNAATSYNNEINDVEARLQVGTTPGNPYVVSSIQNAQGKVQEISNSAVLLKQLSTRVSADVVTTEYILGSIKSAYLVSGAVDEDHTQLKALQKDLEQTNQVLNNILDEINNDQNISEQYIAKSSQTLSNLAEPVRTGSFVAGVAPSTAATPVSPVGVKPMFAGNKAAQPQAQNQVLERVSYEDSSASGFSSKPLFAVKFNKNNVDYADGLNRAVSGALKAKSDILFDVVGVSPSNAPVADRLKSRTYATEVFEKVIRAGVDPANVSLSAKSDRNAQTPEVHIYVK